MTMSIPNAPKAMPTSMAEWMHPATIFGFVAFMAMFNVILGASWFGFKKYKPMTHGNMSMIQKVTLHTLNAGMIFVVVKMVLRLGFAVKYVWVIPGVLNV